MSELTLNEYQALTDKTAIYPGQGGLLGLNYAALEASGEAGEIANKVKKVMRDDLHRELGRDLDADGYSVFNRENILFGTDGTRSYLSDERRDAIAKEVGGALYGLARVASELGLTLGDIAQQNADILASRMERGQIQGSGDDR